MIGGLVARVTGARAARRPVPEQYQSLFGIGLVLVAAVAGETLGNSGFLAAYAAGIAVKPWQPRPV